MIHQAIEDIGVMSALPNMTVLESRGASEVERICAAADSIDGPVYCRVLRGAVPRLFDTPLLVGEVRKLALGTDIMLVTTGIATRRGCARVALERAGVGECHLHLHTIKPFNPARLLNHAASVANVVITLENRLVTNGVGLLVAETLAKAGLGRGLVSLGIQDAFAHCRFLPYRKRY